MFFRKHKEPPLTDLREIDSGTVKPNESHKEKIDRLVDNYYEKRTNFNTTQVFGITKEQKDKFWERREERLAYIDPRIEFQMEGMKWEKEKAYKEFEIMKLKMSNRGLST